jgi:predicted nucleotidyltransferase
MVNIYELKLSTLQQKILRLLCITVGRPVNMNFIAKRLLVSQPAVIKAIPLLKKENLITAIQDKESSRWNIGLNRENRKVLGLKRADNLKQIYDSGLEEYLYSLFPGATVILFGSYSNGEDTYYSDIDLAVIGGEEKKIDPKFSKILEREIIVNYYDSFKKIEINLLNNLLNGIVLKGVINLKDEKL